MDLTITIFSGVRIDCRGGRDIALPPMSSPVNRAESRIAGRCNVRPRLLRRCTPPLPSVYE